MSPGFPLYPYRLSSLLDLTLSDFDDPDAGHPVKVRTAVDERSSVGGIRTYDAFSKDTDWKKLTFKLTVRLDHTDLQRLLPETSKVESEAVLNVRVTCAATKLRHSIRLEASKPGVWIGYTTLQRDDVSLAVVARPELVRIASILGEADSPYATTIGSILALGDSCVLFVDPTTSRTDSGFSISWEDFANSESLWRREHVDDVFHVEPFAAEPRVWLNSRFGQLREILESKAKRGPEAALRDLAATMIAQPALLQLAFASLAAIGPDEGSDSVDLPSGWRSDLLARILPSLYPEEFDDRERARRAGLDLADPDGTASLSSRLGSVIQDMVATYDTVETAIRGYELARERGEDSDE